MFDKKDFIYRKRSFYSQEGCTHIINFFEKRVDLHQVGSLGDRLDFTQKKSTDIVLKRREYTLFEDALQTCLKDYMNEYPSSKAVSHWDLSSTFRIQRYLPGEGYFVEHCEHQGPGDGDKRILAWMVYLNDITDGGYTNFPNQKRRFQPRRGDVLIWPAYFTHTHHGIVSKTQTKYIATGWCSYV
mgnify:CR=1 FL=1|tara:strand:- start:661 stop:1215 length:555 start_codon:yes stop_codon:yes gene_type:complete